MHHIQNQTLSDAVSLYGEMVFHIALRHCEMKEDAEDIFQDVFIALLKRERPFNNTEHMKAWLIRTTLHRIKNLRRYEARHPKTIYDPTIHDKQLEPTAKQEHSPLINLESLSEEQRRAIKLYYEGGYSTKEIAHLEGIKEATVRSRLHRARAKIKSSLPNILALLLACLLLFQGPHDLVKSAAAIDLSHDKEIAISTLPIVSVQNDTHTTKVILSLTVSWNVKDVEWITYSTDSENIYLYSPTNGNFTSLNGGTDHRSVQIKQETAETTLHLVITVPQNTNGRNRDDLLHAISSTLNGRAIAATAHLNDGSTNTVECILVE